LVAIRLADGSLGAAVHRLRIAAGILGGSLVLVSELVCTQGAGGLSGEPFEFPKVLNLWQWIAKRPNRAHPGSYKRL